MQISVDNTAIVLGNGPSLRGFDFISELKGLTTFGLNVAYRYWDVINWYPTYYACLDTAVGECHKEEILRLVRSRTCNGIKKFMLRANVVRYFQKNGINIPEVINFDFWHIRNRFTKFFSDGYQNTGAVAVLWAASLGYKNIVLLGIDANFPVDVLPEAIQCVNILHSQKDRNHSALFKLEKTPIKNDNYFFDGYQQKGDFYNMSDKSRLTETQIHILSWKFIPNAIDAIGNIKIINANPDSKIELFPKTTWNEIKNILE